MTFNSHNLISTSRRANDVPLFRDDSTCLNRSLPIVQVQNGEEDQGGRGVRVKDLEVVFDSMGSWGQFRHREGELGGRESGRRWRRTVRPSV